MSVATEPGSDDVLASSADLYCGMVTKGLLGIRGCRGWFESGNERVVEV